MIPGSALQPLVSHLSSRQMLDKDAQNAILALPHTIKRVAISRYLIQEGQAYLHCFVMLKGTAYRHKILANGSRQLVALHFEGEMVNLHSSMQHPACNNVQALTSVEVALIPQPLMLKLMRSHPSVADAIWAGSLADVSVLREWVTNIGRRDARTRIAHLLCELAVRQGLDLCSGKATFRMPLTQTHLGDALGLTSVHVNRMLHTLKIDGLIRFSRGSIDILDWDKLTTAGDFSAMYLQLEPYPSD